jgi:hypothetical protein
MAERFTSLRDMLDGGGKGKSGDTFQGGMMSGFLNRAGVRPIGYADRQAMPTAPMQRPSLREAAAGGASLPPRMMMTPNSMSDRAAIAAAPRLVPVAAPPAPMTAPPAVRVGQNGVMMHGGSAGSTHRGGRGTVGMPIPPHLQTPEAIRAIEELRRVGLISM